MAGSRLTSRGRDGAPPDIERDGDAEGQAEQQQDAEGRVAPRAGRARRTGRCRCARNSRGIAWTTFIQRLGLRMPSLCSNRARVKPARRRSPIWALELLGLHQEGAAEALGLVELGDGGLALGPVPGHVGAFLRLAVLGLGAELAQARLAGLEPRGLLVDDGADIRDDGLDLLPEVLQVGVGHGRGPGAPAPSGRDRPCSRRAWRGRPWFRRRWARAGARPRPAVACGWA